ncbi:MAG: hypothetical protein SGJ15_00540 [Bacteroidota bacterium]|nr:hypothetical protein [Bacteroidota bacterium]
MKVIRTILFGLLTLNSLAQEQVNYKIVVDEPRKINNFSCNIDLLHMDGGVSNIDGFSFNSGVWGHAMYKQRMGLDYTFRYGILTFGKFASANAKNHINIQTGGFFIFHQNDPLGTNRVALKSESGGTTSDGRAITINTYLTVPSRKWKYKAVRGGIYFNRSGVSIDNPLGKDNYYNYYMLGAYGGICFGSARHVEIQTDKYGAKGVVSHVRICLDALITPISNKPTGVKNAIPVGGRLLVQALPSLRKKDRKGKLRTAMTAEFEVGYRMVDGIYIGGTLSIPISRSLKVLMAKEEDQTPKRTTE